VITGAQGGFQLSKDTPLWIKGEAQGAAFVDQTALASSVSLEQAVTIMLRFRPAWVGALLAFRRVLLRRGAHGQPIKEHLSEPGQCWVGRASEDDFDSSFAVHIEPATGLCPRLVVATTVAKPKSMKGRLYLLFSAPFRAQVLRQALKSLPR